MKDKDFGYVLLLLVAIVFGKDIKDFAAKKLGKEEPAALAPVGAFWRSPMSDDWLKPGMGGSDGLIGQDRLPGSQAANLLEELEKAAPGAFENQSTHHAPRDAFRHAERDEHTLGYPLFPRKPSLLEQWKAESTTGRLDSTSASGEALTEASPEVEQPAHAK